MAWIFLAESADSPWPWNLGSDREPTVKSTDTLRQFFCHDRRRVVCRWLRSGMTCELCDENFSLPWISSPADSHARTSALLALRRAWVASDPVSTSNSFGSLASFDPSSSSWKTYQTSLFEGLSALPWTSLRWGMTSGGRLFQPRKWAPTICGNVGSLLPTLTAAEHKRGRVDLHGVRKKTGRTLTAEVYRRFNLKPTIPFFEHFMGYPIGWTACADWATPWFRKPRGKRSRD